MTLYHFTANRFLRSIKKSGIRYGKILKSDPPNVEFISGYQWLTKNKSFEQDWARGTGRLPYKRNEIRLTIEIPKDHYSDIRPWSQVKFMVPKVADILSAYGDPENWILYEGVVWPKWIVSVDKNTNYF